MARRAGLACARRYCGRYSDWDRQAMLHEFAIAFCLMLVIEGILPFVAPGRWRNMLVVLNQIDDKTMRLIGLGSMLTGTGLLYLIN